MNWLLSVVVMVQILAALVMIGLVLVQHGKGADMGASFGSGASGSLFGATGSANFLSRATAVLAAIFFTLSLALAYVATRAPAEEGGGVIDVIRKQQVERPAPKAEEKPAAQPAPAPAGEAAKDKQVPQ